MFLRTILRDNLAKNVLFFFIVISYLYLLIHQIKKHHICVYKKSELRSLNKRRAIQNIYAEYICWIYMLNIYAEYIFRIYMLNIYSEYICWICILNIYSEYVCWIYMLCFDTKVIFFVKRRYGRFQCILSNTEINHHNYH